MRLFILSALALCCATTLAASIEDDNLEFAPIKQLEDDELDYYPDLDAEEAPFEQAMERLEDEDFEHLPDEDMEDGVLEDVMARFKDFFDKPRRPRFPHKKRRRKRRRRFPKRLRVQLKVFRTASGAARYKYYILQGQNIRHYRVTFSQSQQFRFRRSAQRRTRRCLIRKYRKRCLRLKLFLKGRCTRKVAIDCSGDFETFERANPKTLGKDKVQPKKKKKKPRRRKPFVPPHETPDTSDIPLH